MAWKYFQLSLFQRVYLYGLILLAAIAITAGLTAHLAGSITETPDIHGFQSLFGSLAAGPIQQKNKTDLETMLDNFYRQSHISSTVFDLQGNIILSAGDRGEKVLNRLKIPQGGSHRVYLQNGLAHVIVPLENLGIPYGYAVFSWKGTGHWRLLMVGTAVLIMLTLFPFFAARAITTPLNAITATARQIGQGNLSARTQISRSDEVGKLAEEVDRTAMRIEHLLRSEKALMANISHEIRTPLARIRVLLELLEEEQNGADAIREHLTGLNADVTELERFLEDVFLAAKLDISVDNAMRSSLILRRNPLNLGRILEQVVNQFAREYPEHDFIININKDLPEMIGDGEFIKRLIQNLLGNAVKYSEPGAPVQASVCSQNQSIVLSVKDRGDGIRDEDLQHIFEPFFRGKSSGTMVKPGIGIGLTLCKRIAEAHSGRISARNLSGGGTEFSVVFPINE